MTNVDRRYEKLMAELVELRNKDRSLKNNSGDGTSGGMEARIARLEADMSHVKSDLTQVRSDVGTLKVDVAMVKERVAHLPGKSFVVGSTMSALALLTAVILFADKIKDLIGN